jgi:hypothetical protein
MQTMPTGSSRTTPTTLNSNNNHTHLFIYSSLTILF